MLVDPNKLITQVVLFGEARNSWVLKGFLMLLWSVDRLWERNTKLQMGCPISVWIQLKQGMYVQDN